MIYTTLWYVVDKRMVSLSVVSVALGLVSVGFDAGTHISNRMEDESTAPEAEVEIERVQEYWTRVEDGELDAGTVVTIDGTLSGYGPMVFGPPREIKDRHFRLRELVDGDELDAELDGLISMSSGNPVIRLSPDNGVKYAGLYEGVGRNSVPLLVDEDAFRSWQESTNALVSDVSITGRLVTIPEEWRDLMELFGLDETTGYALSVADEDGIRERGRTRFFEADIWAVFQSEDAQHWISRAPDFTRANDFRRQVKDIVEAAERIGDDLEVVSQYDLVDQPISGYQSVRSQSKLVQEVSNEAVRTHYIDRINEILDRE